MFDNSRRERGDEKLGVGKDKGVYGTENAIC
jgi:hypothetical protein